MNFSYLFSHCTITKQISRTIHFSAHRFFQIIKLYSIVVVLSVLYVKIMQTATKIRKLQAYIRYFLETKSKTSSLFSVCFTYPSKSRLSSSSHFHVSFLIHAAMLFEAKSLVTTPSQCIMGYGTPRPWLFFFFFFFFRYGTAGPWLFFFLLFFFCYGTARPWLVFFFLLML